MVKNPPAMQETLVWSLGQEDALEKGMATHSGILALRIQWTEEPDGLQSMGLQGVRNDWANNSFLIQNQCTNPTKDKTKQQIKTTPWNKGFELVPNIFTTKYSSS